MLRGLLVGRGVYIGRRIGIGFGGAKTEGIWFGGGVRLLAFFFVCLFPI